MPDNERRQWPRVERKIQIDAIVIDPEKEDSLFSADAAWTKDVGGNGLGLVTPARCAVGSSIGLQFHLPGREKAVETKGLVVWSKLEDNPERTYRIGVGFESIEEADREAVMRYIDAETKKW